MPVTIFTIGFTKTSAKQFFESLRDAGVKKVVDVRLNNVSQLAGFAKKEDLIFFLKSLYEIDYEHLLELAPTQQMLDSYKKEKGAWTDYEKRYLSLLEERNVENTISRDVLQDACLLCSEDLPYHCHRRLAVEYLGDRWGDVSVTHIVPSSKTSSLGATPTKRMRRD